MKEKLRQGAHAYTEFYPGVCMILGMLGFITILKPGMIGLVGAKASHLDKMLSLGVLITWFGLIPTIMIIGGLLNQFVKKPQSIGNTSEIHV